MISPKWVALVLVLAVGGSASAQTIRVAPPSGFTGVRVSGRVVAAPGAEGLTDMAVLQGPRFFQTPVRPGQTFLFDDVPPGTYRLSLRTNHGFRSISVVVGREPVRNLELTLARMFELPVDVAVDDGSPRPGNVMFRVMAGQDPSGVVALPQGGRTLMLPPGNTRVFVLPPPGYFVTSFRAGEQDLIRDAVTLAPTLASPPKITVTLTRTRPSNTGTFTVAGRITNNRADTEVLLADETPTLGAAARLGGRTTTGASGEFTFAGVPPGIYSLHVPPAREVLRNVVVPGDTGDLTVSMPAGSIVAGLARVLLPSGGGVPDWPEKMTVVIAAGESRTPLPVGRRGFWTALPPGSYTVRVEGLPQRFTVKTMAAGSVDLLRAPLVVPAGRPAEYIQITLEVPTSEAMPASGGTPPAGAGQ